jgi:hypothetical protein
MSNKQHSLEVHAEKVHMHDVLSDQSVLKAEGVSWDTANIKLKLISQKGEKETENFSLI